jgi:hypothetical protein
MRLTASAVILAALLAAGPARAFDPAGADILGLRLGMPESDIVALLTRQEIHDSVLTRFGEPERTSPMTWCLTAVRGGPCHEDHALLTFEPEKLTLMLRAAPEKQ